MVDNASLVSMRDSFSQTRVASVYGKSYKCRDRVDLQRNYIVLLDDTRLQAVFQIKELENKYCNEEKYYI